MDCLSRRTAWFGDTSSKSVHRDQLCEHPRQPKGCGTNRFQHPHALAVISHKERGREVHQAPNHLHRKERSQSSGDKDQGIYSSQSLHYGCSLVLRGDTFHSDTGSTYRLNGRLHGYNLGVNGHFNINENWYISGRVGAFRADGHADFAVLDVKSTTANPTYDIYRVKFNSTDWYAGLGFGYDFNTNWSVGINYDRYEVSKHHIDANTDFVSLSAEYRF